MKYRQLMQHYSKLRHIYGLPKIHKDDIPLKPIISNKGTTCHLLSHFLVKTVPPYTGKSSPYVQNSALYMEKNHSDEIVKLNAVSVFMRILTNKTQTGVQDKFVVDLLLEECICILKDNLIEILTFCMETTYYGMGSDIYNKNNWQWNCCCHQYWWTYIWNGIRIYTAKAINLA